MGVYIPNMEMPTSCDECPMFNLDIDGGCYCTKYFVIRKKDQDRPDWCPLVPVPKHGRLIDADAEIERVQKLYDKAVEKDPEMGCVNVYEGEIAVLQLAPTIIPAEEGET